LLHWWMRLLKSEITAGHLPISSTLSRGW
jgi:hypothetical protein